MRSAVCMITPAFREGIGKTAEGRKEFKVALESFIAGLLGQDLPVRIKAYDGTDVGPRDARTTITLRSRDALVRMATAPGELGFARAYIAGDIEIDGNIYDVLSLKDALPVVKLTLDQLKELVQTVGLRNLRKIPPPPEEHRRQGRFHTRRSDSSAIQHHYNVSNEFFELVLGSSLTYSCAVFEDRAESLERAQQRKYELICQKLGLQPGMRLLDIGCGWGGMVLHAAKHHGVQAVGVTISENQANFAEKQVAEAGLTDLIEIRTQDYRDVADGPYDAVSSIGMFEHVGMRRLSEYFNTVNNLLAPGGRLLNHAISRRQTERRSFVRRTGFLDRYVFPDGELHEVGSVITALQNAGLEVRHLENLREHYALTLRRWVFNLEENWEAAVAEVGEGRAKIWQLYMAGSAVMFEANDIHVDQVLAIKTPPDGDSHIPLRPTWN